MRYAVRWWIAVTRCGWRGKGLVGSSQTLPQTFHLDDLKTFNWPTPMVTPGRSERRPPALGFDAAALHRDRKMLGQLLETLVYQELRRQASWQDQEFRFHHFRDKDSAEVDVVLERGAHELAGVEVKASSTVTAADFAGLRKLKEAAGSSFKAGVVLYDGEASVGFGHGLFAVPVRALWEMT